MKKTAFILLFGLWLGASGQTRHIQFINEHQEEVPFVLIELNEALLYTNEHGRISLEANRGENLNFKAFSYRDSNCTLGDQEHIKIVLIKESFMLQEVTVNDAPSDSFSIPIKSPRLFSNSKDYQREPGECFLVQLPCKSCKLTSIEVEVKDVSMKNAGLRMVAYHKDRQIASGLPITLEVGFRGKLILSLEQAAFFQFDSIRIGIEFIRYSTRSSSQSNRVSSFSIKGRKGLYTKNSNGLTLNGFKIRTAENPYYLLSFLKGERFFYQLGNGKFAYAPRLRINMAYLEETP